MSIHNIHFQDRRSRIIPNTMISAVMEKNLGNQGRVRNSHRKRASGVRAIEVSV